MSAFGKNRHIKELVKISEELCDIAGASGLLSWDQETLMPPKGAKVRAHQLATIAGVYHEKLTDKKVGGVLKKLEGAEDLNEYDRALVREVKREYEKSTKLPKKLVQEISEAASRAFDAWQEAKQKSDWGLFAKNLERLLRLKIEAANLMRKNGQSIYDLMLDDHEEGLTEREVERVFGPLRATIIRLAKDLSELTKGRDKELRQIQPGRDALIEATKDIISRMGFDWEAGRQDLSAHPFETSLGIGDVRMTTWRDGKDVGEMVMVAMHETGHALYEQGIDPKLERTHLGGGQGLVLHESQSRLWENMIGRSSEFWLHYYPIFQKFLPGLDQIPVGNFVKGINVVKPSLIRVQADEVTYGLHIMLRFEIERDLVAGRIGVQDLPIIWNRKMKEMLGVVPENDQVGVLQDVHWSHGSFGYFPTYLLGTMTAAQIWNTAVKNDNVKNSLKKGELKPLREWLRENIHKFGRLYTAKEMVRKVTGENLNSRHFVEYLENKFRKLYN